MKTLSRLGALALLISSCALAQTGALLPTPQQFFDANGYPLAGGLVYTCAAGSSCPGTPLASYTDGSLGTPNANPVVLDASGSASIWGGGSAYKIVVETAAGVVLHTQDNVMLSSGSIALNSLAGPSGAALVNYTAPGTGGTTRTVAAKLGDSISVQDYGAKGDGSADDTININKAGTVALAAGKALYFPGTANYYRLTGPILLTDSQTVYGDGASSKILMDANSANIFEIRGGHNVIRDLFLTKAAGRTNVRGVVINPQFNTLSSYNKLDRLRIEGNGSADLMTAAVFLPSGIAAGCGGGADCGSFYNEVLSTDVRYAVDGLKLGDTTNLIGANATRSFNLRVGDSTNGVHIVRGESANMIAFSGEGLSGKAVWIENSSGGGAPNNNDCVFVAPRFEANTVDVQVDANSHSNAFFLGEVATAKIVDNGVSTVFMSANRFGFGGITYSDSDAILHLAPFNGSSFSTPVSTSSTFASSATAQNTNVFGGALTTDQTTGLTSFVNIQAPNANVGQPVTIMGDSAGRSLALVSQGFSVSGTTGTATQFSPTGQTSTTGGLFSSGTYTFGNPISVTGTVNATTGYKYNGTAGATTTVTCTGGQHISGITVAGGLVTAVGACN